VHPYWLSIKAKKLFASRKHETVFEGIFAQIDILIEANKMHMSYLEVIDEALDKDSLTSYIE
jgi:hypothetical protein